MTEDQAALVFAGPGWHRGVVGIVASRLVERFCRPVFVLSEEDGDRARLRPQHPAVSFAGRARIDARPVHALRRAPPGCRSQFTCGIGAGIPAASQRLCGLRGSLAADFRPQLDIDALVDLKELTTGPAVAELLSLAPFGFGNPPPVLALLGAQVASEPVWMKEKHLRVHLRHTGRSLFPTGWNFSGRVPAFSAGALTDAAFSVEEDTYAASRGEDRWSAVLRDLRPAVARAASS